MGLFLWSFFACVALTGSFGVEEDDLDGTWSVLVKYKTKKENFHFRYLMVCGDGTDDCNTIYYMAPAYKFFQNVQDALAWLVSENKSEQDIYGVYTLTPYQTARVQTGTRLVTRNVPTEVEEPVFEWVQRDTNKVQQE